MTLFVIAVSMIVLATTLAVRLVWYLYLYSHAYVTFDTADARGYHQKLSTFTFFDPAFFIFMAMAIVIVILSASLYKMHTLKKGGPAVAEMLGGRKISDGSADQA